MTDREKLIEAMAVAMYDCCSHTDCDLEARAALSAIEAAGYVLVPREPTEEMVDAMHAASDEYKSWIEAKKFPRPIKVAHLYAAAISAFPMGEKDGD